jgi:tetrahydromethanopterin S-methyltransferase subunit G
VSVIIFNMIGGIVMSQSNLEKQEAKLKQLNQKIKAEKNKIEQNLGKQIIRSDNLDYATLTTPQIKMIAKKVAAFLNQAQNNQ